MVTRRVLVALVVLLATFAPPAGADDNEPPLIVNGISLRKWVLGLSSSDPKLNKQAAQSCTAGRFLVGASDVVVPAIQKQLTSRKAYQALALVRVYGPHAEAVRDRLQKWDKNEGDGNVLIRCARIMILDDANRCITNLKATLKAKKSAFPKRGASTLDKLRLSNPLLFMSALGVRGDFVVPTLKKLFPPKAPFTIDDLLYYAQSLGPAAAPLTSKLAKHVAANDDVRRYRVVATLAEQDKLPDKTTKLVLQGAYFDQDDLQQDATRLIACMRTEPKAALVKYFQTLGDHKDAGVVAWSQAGLARLQPDDQVIDALTKAMVHKRDDVRIAAAHGLMSLTAHTEDTLAGMEAGLQDVDMRVRWRMAVSLVKKERAVAKALPELARILGGPGDEERIAAFRAIQSLGPIAQPLDKDIRPWVRVPFKRISGPAKQALAAIQPPK